MSLIKNENIKITYKSIYIQILIVLCSLLFNKIGVQIVLVCIQLYVQIYAYKRLHQSGILFSSIFVVISFVFNVTGVLCDALSNDSRLFIGIYDDIYILSSLKFYICGMFFFFVGSIIKKINNTNRYIIDKKDSLYTYVQVKYLGIVFVLIGILPKFYIDIQRFMLRMSGSYSDVGDLNLKGIGGISYLYYIGIDLLIYYLGKINKVKWGSFVLIFALIGETFAMLSGKRYDSITFIVSILYIYFIYVKKSSIKEWKKYILSCLIMIVIINISQRARYDRFSISNILMMIEGCFSLKDNVFLLFFKEFGASYKTLIYSYMYVPNYIEFGITNSFLENIISVFIPFSGIFGTEFVGFVELFPNNRTMGGNWIAEIYYYFGFYGIFFCYIIGNFVNKLDLLFYSKKIKDNVVAIVFLFVSIHYIRNCIYSIRYGVLFAIFAIVFMDLIASVKNKSGKYYSKNTRKGEMYV